jgi:hypothetical protein
VTIRQEGDILYLSGRCSAEDAETLLVALQDRPGSVIDASSMTRLHLAVAQVLLALIPQVIAKPSDPMLTATVFDRLSHVKSSALRSIRDSA